MNRNFWRYNGLTLVLAALFLLTWGLGQSLTGRQVYNNDRAEHHLAAVSLGEYWRSPHFAEATFENWESEFFQMGIYVWITSFLFQKGSAESNDPDAVKAEPRPNKRSPWPVRRGGWWLRAYRHSLSAAFLSLFLLSFGFHALAGWRLFNEENLLKNMPAISFWAFTAGAEFWFQSFQNWQSEFLAILSMVVLSIFFREKNSPESKPVNMPNADMD